MNRDKFLKILSGEISLINHELLISADNNDLEVVVFPSHVRKILLNYLQGSVSISNLIK